MALRRDMSFAPMSSVATESPCGMRLGMRAHHLSLHTGLALNLRGRDAKLCYSKEMWHPEEEASEDFEQH